ncbi:MAG: hypothetical protein JNN30_08540 [Rhodanobacteraceae bacterium]|nr:hypothetical protein [Rhodanobacteraceae bacterium]
MNEQILDLGGQRFGLLHLPQDRRSDTALVLLNAGMIHRTGPFRLYVELARRLTAAGYVALRWDAPGIGDALAAADRTRHEIHTDVLDRVQAATGCTRFVLGGICSAADHAWQIAGTDARVQGLLLLDGLARPGFWYRVGQLRLAALRPPSRWWAMFRQQLSPPAAAAPRPTVNDYRDWPAIGTEREQLAQLLQRDVRLFALYTGGAANYMLHRRQFHTTFGPQSGDERITLQHWPECDHLFFDPDDRDRLIESVLAWVQAAFPRPTHG